MKENNIKNNQKSKSKLKERREREKFFTQKHSRMFFYCKDYFFNTISFLNYVASANNKLSVNVNINDMYAILAVIGKKIYKCKNLEDLDKILDENQISKYYKATFKVVCCRGNEITESIYKYLDEGFDTGINIWCKSCLNDSDSIFSFSNSKICKDLLNSILSGYDYELIAKMLKNISNQLEVFNNNDGCQKSQAFKIAFYQNVIYSYAFFTILGYVRMLFIGDYVDILKKSDEFSLIVNNYILKYGYSHNYPELYDIYLQFYEKMFEHRISSYDFNLMIFQYRMSIDESNIINSYKNTLDLLEVDYLDIINSYLITKDSNDVFSYCSNNIDSDKLKNLVIHYNSRELLHMFSRVIANELIGKISLKNWMQGISEYHVFVKKCEVYKKKYELLNVDKSKFPLISQLMRTYENISNGYDFEEFLKSFYELLGYKVKRTIVTGDQGADLILEKNCEKTVVQAKFYSSPVGNKAVQEVVASLMYYGANKSIVITNSTFTNSAIQLAKANNTTLVDGNTLINSFKLLI